VRRGRRVAVASMVVGGLAISWASSASAQTITLGTGNGVPVQIIPKYDEVGLGSYSMPTPVSTGLGAGSGSGTTASDGTSSTGTGASVDTSGTSSGASTPAGSSSALDTMMGTSWGAQASQNATALGVNPSALAATCVVESGCQNVSGTGSITGAFQMTGSTYTASMNAALAQDPTLASTAVSGIAGQNDPATQSIAAAEYLKQGANYLQTNGVSSPDVTDVRAYYNFGPAGGLAVASANDTELMSDKLDMYSSSQLASNGITAGETVGQWKAGVAAKIGDAANQSVLM
jgi:hypothetical protein